MSNYVKGVGPSNAKLAIVGETPGAEEDRLGLPFQGSTGKILDNILRDIGTSRDSVYLTNVIKHRPPKNDPKRIKELGFTLDDYIPQLKAELAALGPNCVLALGNTALTALTGKRGIEKWRGSILPGNFSGIKVVSTIHPAALLHAEGDASMKSWKDLTYIKWDFARALKQSTFPEYDPPRNNLVVCRNSMHLHNFLERNEGRQFCAVDIETFKTIPICISFAFSRHEAISVPLFNNLTDINPTGITRTDMIEIWKMVARVLADPNIYKIGQNFKFDEGQLVLCDDRKVWMGLVVRSFYFDTMLAFRTLYCELASSLAFQTSVLTEEPYYKDEGKEYNPKKDKLDRLLLYNAKDAIVTFECFEEELRELQERGLDRFFFEKVMPLHQFYQKLENVGIARDDFAKRVLFEKYMDEQMVQQKELDELIGRPLNVMSSPQVSHILYNAFKLPQRKGADEKTLDALMRNNVKLPEHRRVIELILKIRKVRKVIGTYINVETDIDNRFRTSYKIALETGRTSTSILKQPIRTRKMGAAFQTLTKHGEVGGDLRSMYVPDPGYVIMEPDLSQAEARVVALLARDEKMMQMFDYKVDLHRVTYAWIKSLTVPALNEFFEAGAIKAEYLAGIINKELKKLIDDHDRQLGKKFRHAGHYDMKKHTASLLAGVSEWTAGKILIGFHETNPKIKAVFHKEIIDALQHNNRTLVSPHGRERVFLNRWGEDLFKEGYAQIPQATVSDHLKFAAQRVQRRIPHLRIFSESHDSFAALVKINEVDNFVRVTKEELETPIDFSNCTLSRGKLVIPSDFSIGKQNWMCMEKFIL